MWLITANSNPILPRRTWVGNAIPQADHPLFVWCEWLFATWDVIVTRQYKVSSCKQSLHHTNRGWSAFWNKWPQAHHPLFVWCNDCFAIWDFIFSRHNRLKFLQCCRPKAGSEKHCKTINAPKKGFYSSEWQKKKKQKKNTRDSINISFKLYFNIKVKRRL